MTRHGFPLWALSLNFNNNHQSSLTPVVVGFRFYMLVTPKDTPPWQHPQWYEISTSIGVGIGWPYSMNTAVDTPVFMPAHLEVCGSPWFTGFLMTPNALGFQGMCKMPFGIPQPRSSGIEKDSQYLSMLKHKTLVKNWGIQSHEL